MLNLSNLIKNKNDMILVYNSKLGTLQKRLDMKKVETTILETKIEEKERMGKERLQQLGITNLAINNLYERVSERPNVKKLEMINNLFKPEDHEQSDKKNSSASSNSIKSINEKLLLIMNRVLDLDQIVCKIEQQKK
jgi:hypothetical protein